MCLKSMDEIFGRYKDLLIYLKNYTKTYLIIYILSGYNRSHIVSKTE